MMSHSSGIDSSDTTKLHTRSPVAMRVARPFISIVAEKNKMK